MNGGSLGKIHGLVVPFGKKWAKCNEVDNTILQILLTETKENIQNIFQVSAFINPFEVLDKPTVLEMDLHVYKTKTILLRQI